MGREIVIILKVEREICLERGNVSTKAVGSGTSIQAAFTSGGWWAGLEVLS